MTNTQVNGHRPILTPTVGIRPFFERIAEIARIDPKAPAITIGMETTSYGELMTLAHSLADSITGAIDDSVAITAHKTIRTIAYTIGCLLQGRQVLLLAPTMPDERAAEVIARSRIRIVIDPRIGGERRSIPHTIPRHAHREYGRNQDEQLLLTTSGTTGVPKVVPLTVPAIDRFIAWATDEFRLGDATPVLNLAPLNFDLTLLEVWATLAAGGRCVMVSPEQAIRGKQMLDLIATEGISLVQSVPTFLRLMISAAEDQQQLPEVSTIIITGDRIDGGAIASLRRIFPNARIVNIYGMTETNDSFLFDVTGNDLHDAPLPIGTPIPGVEALVHTDTGEVVPTGIGELLVRTPFQATRYLDPQMSLSRFFVPNSDAGTKPFVRTGDIVELRDGRPALLLGRIDRLVKIRGIAVDLAEVERIVEGHADVLQAVAIAEAEHVSGHRLVVVAQRDATSGLDALALRSYLTTRLARGSMPAELHLVDRPLPLTITGKIDRSSALTDARARQKELI